MKTFTYEEILQVLGQIYTTLDDYSKGIDKNQHPIATAKLKIYKQDAIHLKHLYTQFATAKKKVKE